MRKVSTNITLDPKLKKEATLLLKEMGLDLSTYVSLSLKAMINEQGLPFNVKAKSIKQKISPAMKEVMEEYEDMCKHPEKYKNYTVKELLNELHANRQKE